MTELLSKIRITDIEINPYGLYPIWAEQLELIVKDAVVVLDSARFRQTIERGFTSAKKLNAQ